MASRFYQVFAVLVSLFVTGFAFTTVDECPKFKDDGDDVTVKLCEDTCYYFHTKEAMTFKEASSVCGGRGGSLVMPRSKDISDFLKEELAPYKEDKKEGTEPSEKLTNNFWVGMMHQKSARNTPSFFFWLNGESVDSKYAQNVLEYGDAFTIPRKNGVWQFQNSDKDVKNKFVCEIKGKNSKTTQSPTTTKPKIPKSEVVCPKITDDENLMKLFGKVCFYIHQKDTKPYDGASKFCSSHGGTLAAVKTKNIDQFLQESLKTIIEKPNESLWIGLHSEDDSRLPSVWDDGSPVHYTNFRYSFPIWGYYTISVNDNWEAYPIAIRQHFICQFNAEIVAKE